MNVIKKFSDAQLHKLYRNYRLYDQLLAVNKSVLSIEEKRDALSRYMNYLEDENQSDRKEILLPYIKNNDIDGFITAITTDQYMEEPLMHIIDLI
jgi:hypothetical protein